MLTDAERAPPAPRVALHNNPKFRALFYQLVLLAAVLWFGYEFALNAKANLDAQKIASGFGFLDHTAGFGVSQSLIPYSEQDSYRRVFLVGLLNTLLVAAVGIVFATVLGFLIGIARLSPNWLLARLAGGYVELIRNLPLLFQILFWYLAVLGTLPGPRQSLSLLGEVFVNNRGIFVPRPVFGAGSQFVLAVLLLAIAATIWLRIWAGRRQNRTGQPFPVLWSGLGLIVGAPAVVLVLLGFPITFEVPQLRGFNFVGGIRLIPEFVALLIALTTYTAAFIAEVVRAGILAVSRGQTEAASALGLRRGLTLASRRRAAGAARDRAAADQPVSQPDQELLARGRDRLSRPVRGVRRHDAQPDRPGDRDHRHHHGGLSRPLAGHQRADELVQRPYPGDGALMAMDAQSSYLRRAIAEPEPPPTASRGAVGWLRQRLFAGPLNTVLTIVSSR